MTGNDLWIGWNYFSRDDETPGVAVTTREGYRLTLTLDEVIRACRSAEEAKEYIRQCQGVFDRATSWLMSHVDGIELAYLTFGAETLDLTVVLRSAKFDQGIEDDLIGLDLEIAQNDEFHLIRLNVVSLPPCSRDDIYRSFVLPRPGPTLIWDPRPQD